MDVIFFSVVTSYLFYVTATALPDLHTAAPSAGWLA